MCRRLPLLLAVLVVVTAGDTVPAQLRPQPVAERPGVTALTLMLRKLASTGTFMQTTAHPDDEDNALLAMVGYGLGMRAVLVSATRGDGGQNEIGPELFQALGVLRTEELLAVHRFDGAEQYFTRAMDFGFSFSVGETLDKWGRQEIVGDYVRHIRAIRPDVIAGFLCGGEGGGQHHQASTRLTLEAAAAATDPTKYPEQIKEGLRPWRAARVFCTEPRFGPKQQNVRAANELTVDSSGFDSVLGRTYAELGLEARSMHRCQGTSQLLLLPGETQNRTYRLADSAVGDPRVAPGSMFADIDTTIIGLVRFAPHLGAALSPALKAISGHVTNARNALESTGPTAALPHLAQGLSAVRGLRQQLKSSNGEASDVHEVDFRLARKEQEFQDALLLAAGVRLEALSSDGLVIPGQTMHVTTYASNQADEPVGVRGISFAAGKSTGQACSGPITRGKALSCDGEVRVARSAGFSTPYWQPRPDAARYDFEPGVPFGVPFTPTPFTATFALTIAGAAVSAVRPIEFRYDNILAGEKRMEVHVVPAFAVTSRPAIAVVPSGAAARRSVEVTVTNHTTGAATANVALQLPQGWRSDPAAAPVTFSREDEQATVAFTLTVPPVAKPVEYRIRAIASSGEAQSDVGYEIVEYPHIRRRHVVQAAETRVKVIDVAIAPGLRVGYIMGVGDQVPAAIEQLGAELHMITPAELASGDLSRYSAIVTGVRAYERRPDLRANNHRLLAYAANGGIVLVQYNKFEFNEARYGPYPGKVGSNRVTDENSTVDLLVPDHPVFTRPNGIGPSAWTGWVQERGLYFLGERDTQYVDLIRLEDPFPLNKGPKTGALVEARVGRGRWIYIGLGLWRQLPAGTDGAYQLMANLLSLGARR
jgi:LmbE family N-acetylglucosaminyl deacetylase